MGIFFMRLMEVLESDSQLGELRLECSEFIAATGGLPTMKSLPSTYQPVHRVKVRQQKRADVITYVFNEAFSQVHNLRQVPPPSTDCEPFYVFPINGYKFLYSKEVRDSSADYKQVIDTVFEQFTDMNRAAEIITDIVKYTYTDTNLEEGVRGGAEIIFYNIPYYYAVKQSSYPDYKTILL
jgi:hypothetical protein